MMACINFTGYIAKTGYGQVGRSGKQRQAHREAYVKAFGAIPKGLIIDHLCRNKQCINPKHLQVVTHKINSQRAIMDNSIKRTCPLGHPYFGKNLILAGIFKIRKCRICIKFSQKKIYLKRIGAI